MKKNFELESKKKRFHCGFVGKLGHVSGDSRLSWVSLKWLTVCAAF